MSADIYNSMVLLRHVILCILIVNTLSSALYVPIIYLDFNIRKDFIVKTLCINKYESITTCGGSCYLNRQLEISFEEQKQEDDIAHRSLPFSFYNEAFTSLEFSLYPTIEKLTLYIWKYENLPDFSLESIFRPPRI